MRQIWKKEKPARTISSGRARLTRSRVIGVYGGPSPPADVIGSLGCGDRDCPYAAKLVTKVRENSRRNRTSGWCAHRWCAMDSPDHLASEPGENACQPVCAICIVLVMELSCKPANATLALRCDSEVTGITERRFLSRY